MLAVRGVLVAGSEVPNLLEADAATTLVVSQDVDVAIPIAVQSSCAIRFDPTFAILSLLDARPGMPDPRPQRSIVDALSRRLEAR